jgi:hypothetical protein
MRPCNVKVLIFSSAFIVAPAQAQGGVLNFTPDLARHLVVEITTQVVSSTGEYEPTLPSSGTIVRQANDTIYVVTSSHQLDEAVAVLVRLQTWDPEFHFYYPVSRALPAEIRFRNEESDLALIAVAYGNSNQYFRVRRDTLHTSRRVFAFGCPAGECWAEPEVGTYVKREGSRIVFRTPYLKAGVSGGPLVDEAGAVMGIILSHEAGEGVALAWPAVEAELQARGYAANLRTYHGNRLGGFSVLILLTGTPPPGSDSDERALSRGTRWEFGYAISPSIELVAGFAKFSMAIKPLPGVEVDWREAFVGDYGVLGVRASKLVSRSLLRRNYPDVYSGGLEVLFPWDDAYIVTQVPSDSVDLATGEYARIRSVIRVPSHMSFGVNVAYNLNITAQWAFVARASGYMLSVEYPISSTYPQLFGVIEIGTSFKGIP